MKILTVNMHPNKSASVFLFRGIPKYKVNEMVLVI